VQRFSGTLRANVHFHLVALDGAYHRPETARPLEFQPIGPPTALEIEDVTHAVARAVRRLLVRRGLLTPEGELAPRESQEVTPLERLWQVEAAERVPKGALDAGERPQIRPEPSMPTLGSVPVCDVDGFNLHADVAVPAGDREGRFRLCRYGSRPAFADEQFSFTADGRIAFALRSPHRHRATHLFFRPAQLLRRLAWLVAPPRQHLVRYQGVLGPAAKSRAQVVPQPPVEQHTSGPLALPSVTPRGRRSPYYAWASLLRRVYGDPILRSARKGCTGTIEIISVIRDPDVIERILTHLQIPPQPPPSPRARDGPEADSLFDP
jgi:hypothetical protein